MPFSRVGLEWAGFDGWVTFDRMRLATRCTDAGGVYVVVPSSPFNPTFNNASCAGWFKGRNPTVSRDALQANWVEGATCIYIGQSINVRRRLKEFADFGTGKATGHWGGRLIWQLADHPDLLVGWKETSGPVTKVRREGTDR